MASILLPGSIPRTLLPNHEEQDPNQKTPRHVTFDLPSQAEPIPEDAYLLLDCTNCNNIGALKNRAVILAKKKKLVPNEVRLL